MANFEVLAWAALAASVLLIVTLHLILYQKLSGMGLEKAIFRDLVLKNSCFTRSG